MLIDNNFKTDILFIDGDHSYDGVIQDFDNYEKFVNSGGYIIFDDYMDKKNSPEVKKAVDYIVTTIDKKKYEIIGCLKNIVGSYGNDIVGPYLNEFIIKKKNNKYAIVMATYYRKNDTTIKYLKRSLDSIINQTYNNWDLIIVSDKYEKEEELLDIINIYKSKTNNNIIYINNQNVERDNVKNKLKLWCCAGANSINLGLKYARENNYIYYVHIDDDDWWDNNHLEMHNKAYKNYSNCIFVNTQSTYIGKRLPDNICDIYENNMLPKPGGMIHSSFGFRLDVIDFYYDTDLYNGINTPADANMLYKIKTFLLNNKKYCSIYIPELTCYHDEEGLSKS